MTSRMVCRPSLRAISRYERRGTRSQFSRHWWWGIISLLAVGTLLGACAGDKADPTGVLAPTSLRADATRPIIVPAGRPLVVGVSVALTGPDAVRGIEDRDAVVVAVNRWKALHGDKLRGHAVSVRAEDDGCTEAESTVRAADRLLHQEGLVGVIGPQCSAGARAALPTYAQAGIVVIAGAATQSDLVSSGLGGGFFFRTAYRNELQGIVSAQFIAETLKAQHVVVIDDSEAYGQDLAAAVAMRLEGRGVQVTHLSVRRGAVDFSEVAGRVAQAAPDFVGFAGFNPEAALFYRQLRDAGYTGPFGAGDAAASVPTFVAPVGAKAAEGVYFTGCAPPLPAGFRADFKRVRGAEPAASAFTAHFADAARILLDAVDAVATVQGDGSLAIDPVRLRDAVRASKLSDAISGAVAFDAQGDRLSTAADLSGQARELGLAGCQVQRGVLVTLFP